MPGDNLGVIRHYLKSISSSINFTPKITLRSRYQIPVVQGNPAPKRLV